MLAPEQTLNLYPQLDHIQGEDREIILEVIQKFKTPFRPRGRLAKHDITRLNYISAVTAKYFEITPEDMTGKSQTRLCSDARAVFMAVAFQKTSISMVKTAEYLNRVNGAGQNLIKNVASLKEVRSHIPKVIKLL